MKAVQLVGPRDLRVHDVADPAIGPDEVLLKVLAAGLCHSDLHVAQSSAALFRRPVVLGHEVAGEVLEVGAEVKGWEVGGRAVVHLCWSCGECVACQRGDDNVCTARGRMAQPPAPGLGPDGGMAELMAVPARYLVDIGELDPIRAAPLADAAMTPYHAINSSSSVLVPGSTAVVMGIGGLGHVAVQILATRPGVRIVALDVDEVRLKLALALGAEEVVVASPDAGAAIRALTGGLGADAIFDFVGNAQTTATAVAAVAPGGMYQIAGLGGGPVPINAEARTGRGWPWGAWLRSSYGGTRADLEACVALAREGLIEVDVETYPLTDALAAFERLDQGLVRGRAVLIPGT